MRAPRMNTPDSTNSSSTAKHDAIEKPSIRPGSQTADAMDATTNRSTSSASTRQAIASIVEIALALDHLRRALGIPLREEQT